MKQKIGFNPNLKLGESIKIGNQMRNSINIAKKLDFDLIELTCTFKNYDKGLNRVFDYEFFRIVKNIGPDLEYHIHMYHDPIPEIGINSKDEVRRRDYIEKVCETVNHFEKIDPKLYIIHSGTGKDFNEYKDRKLFNKKLTSLKTSLVELTDIYGDLIAIENGRQKTFLRTSQNIKILREAFLKEYNRELGLVFDLGLAFQAVGEDEKKFSKFMDDIKDFDVKEIHWHDVSSRRPHWPLGKGDIYSRFGNAFRE